MAAVLLVPTLAALGVGGVRVFDGLSTSRDLNTLVQQVDLANRAANLTQELQIERDLAVEVTASNRVQGVDDYKAEQAKVDGDVAVFRQLTSESGQYAPTVQGAYKNADEWLGSLTALRGAVSPQQPGPDQRFTEPAALTVYNSVIGSVLDVNKEVANAAANTQLNRIAQAAYAINDAKEELAQQRSIVLGAGILGQFLNNQDDQIRGAQAQFNTALAQFQSVATPQQQLFYSARVAGPAVDDTSRVTDTALLAWSTGRPLGIDPGGWRTVSGTTSDLVWSVDQSLFGQLRDDAQSYANAAQFAAIRDGAFILLFLLVAIAFAALIARTMLRPLRTLRYGALEIAQKELPEAIKRVNENPADLDSVGVSPVPVHSRDEIGEVAKSFDAVHQQALRLAAEQALLRNNVNDLFVNLARRSQTLVQRQLSLIDRLEQDEQDPDQLSSLFELDHLATRMRRNNENLLILGGTDLTRRMMQPVPLTEVVGAAVSEVEQYARIVVSDTPELAVLGRVVNDFVHLVAELLENATVFSNPDTEVTVHTAYRRQELLLEIRDRGVGIEPDDLVEINERLRRPPDIDVAVSRRMGLYVVGQLARRHNIIVQLYNNDDGGGVTATVRLSGEYISQLTPNGPMPMPDIRGLADEQARDQMTDSGTHAGLAAAFGNNSGRPGRERAAPAGMAEDVLEPPPSEMPTRAVPSLAAEPVRQEWADQEQDWAGQAQEEHLQPQPSDGAELPTGYSVHVASSDSFGATDIPAWPSTQLGGDRSFTQQRTTEYEWPVQGSGAAVSEGPQPDPLSSQDLFRSPFEAEKTTQFDADGAGWESLSGADFWRSGGAEGSGVGDGQHAIPNAEPDDAPTQRLPIYEAVLSQWFRETGDGEDSTLTPPGSASAPSGSASAPPGSGSAPPGSGSALPDFGSLTDRLSEPQEGGAPRPEPSVAASSENELADRAPRHEAPPDPGWGYADAGWQAAEALAQQAGQQQEKTAAGLPKRVPKSNLVPGSAAFHTPSPTPSRPMRTRSADAVRGRMSNFQQGVRRGRHAKVESEPSRSIPSRREEHE